MRIQAITRDNSYGLSKDVQVLKEALEPHGHTVDFTAYDRPRNKGHWDWNIHLELIDQRHFNSARVNVFVPNPEWFDMAWMPHLGRFDYILAKTRDTERIFRGYHKEVIYTSWTTPDPKCEVDYGNPRMIHTAGHSIMKGTAQVIEAMRRVPDLHLDLIVERAPKHLPPNVRPHIKPTKEKLCELRRAPIHVQPSTYEGFGHVINEARAMGALVITTAAPPMEELVTTGYAFLSPAGTTRIKSLAVEQIPAVEELANCLRLASDSVKEHGKTWGDRAKVAYQEERTAFHERINSLIQ